MNLTKSVRAFIDVAEETKKKKEEETRKRD